MLSAKCITLAFLVRTLMYLTSEAAYTTDFSVYKRTQQCEASAYVTSQYAEIATLTTQSKGECAFRCKRNELCYSFVYDITSKQCMHLDEDYLRTVCDDGIDTWNEVCSFVNCSCNISIYSTSMMINLLIGKFAETWLSM